MRIVSLYEILSRLWPTKPPKYLSTRLEKFVIHAALGIDAPTLLKTVLGLLSTSLAVISILTLISSPSYLTITILVTSALVGSIIPLLHASLASSDRARSTEEELPFFVLLTSIFTPYQSYSLTKSFETISKTGQDLMPYTHREALIEAAERKFRTTNPLDSLSIVAKNHPSQSWRIFIQGYVSTALKGGSVSSYLIDQLDLSLNRLKERWQHIARRTGDIVELSAISLALTPTMAAMTMFIYPGDEALNTIYIIIASLPAITALIVALIATLQPGRYDRHPTYPLLFVLAVTLVGVILIKPHMGWATSLLFSSSLALTLSTPLAEHHLSEVRNAERSLTNLIREIQEILRTGFSPLEAIGRLDETRYGALSKTIAGAKFRLTMGIPPSRALRIDHPSWIVRTIFFALAQACESGGGLAEVQLLTSFTERVQEAKKAMQKEASTASAIALALPFLSAFGLTTLSSIAEQASFLLQELKAIGTVDLKTILALGHFASVESSILMGFILSKAAFGTVRSLLFPFILSLSTVLASLIFGLMGV